MRLLLDTHAFLWFITADPRLSPAAENAIRQRGNMPFLSLQANRIELLPIELRHTFEIARLPLHHRDPFDRLLIAQAISEGIPLLSADAAFDAYAVSRQW